MPWRHTSYQSVLLQADTYRAKSGGKNKFFKFIFSPCYWLASGRLELDVFF